MEEQAFEMKGKTNFKTFAYMINAARGLALTAKEYEHGSTHSRLAAVVFSAFSIEAVLNDIGEQKLGFWPIVEPRLSWRLKLDLIAHELNFKPDFGARPYQTLSVLFKLRDKIAHGRSVEIESSYMHEQGKPDPFDRMDPDWLKACADDEAVAKVIEDATKIINELGEKAGFDPSYSATISSGSFSGGLE